MHVIDLTDMEDAAIVAGNPKYEITSNVSIRMVIGEAVAWQRSALMSEYCLVIVITIIYTQRARSAATAYHFSSVELWMNEFAINDARSFGGRRQQPQHEQDLHLIVERNPANAHHILKTRRLIVNRFSASCSKLLLFKGFSAILV